jgi:hypothetical protein
MTSLQRYCTVSGTVFAAVALIQLGRAATGFPIEVNEWLVPRALSLLAGCAAAALSFWAWRLRGKAN